MTGPIRCAPGVMVLAVLALTAGCVQTQPARDTGDTLTPTAPSLPSPLQPLAYEPDMRQLFAADCVYCHGGYRADDDYYMRTYEEVTRGLRPGTDEGGLIHTTRPDGSMFKYFSGSERTRQLKSDMVYRWVVTDSAQRTR
jgi:hypothetical protein